MRPLFLLGLLFGFCSLAHGQEGCTVPEASGESLEPAALLDLPSDQFFRGLKTLAVAEHPPATLWPLLERCLRERVPDEKDVPEVPDEVDEEAARAAWEREYACATLTTELASRGASSDHESLWEIFDQLEGDDALRGAIVRGVLDSRLALAAGHASPVAARTGGEPDPLIPPVPARARRLLAAEPEPSWLADAEPELRDAWRTVSGARLVYLQATLALAGDEPLSFHSAEGRFFEAISDYLRGRIAPAQAVRRIGRFEWGAWCGTGANAFTDPRDRALLLAFIDLGRPDLAAVPLLDMAREERDAMGVAWRGLATRLGFDWEWLALGSFLTGDASAATSLAVHGSEQGARRLLSALAIPAPYGDAGELLGHSEQAIASVAALVAEGDSCGDTGLHSLDVERKASELPADVQSDALSALAALVDEEAGLDEASEAARQLHRLCRRESVPAFEQMARSRYASVRVLGAQALQALGREAPAARVAAPVSFRLRVDGVPWQGPVHTTVQRRDRTSSETRQANERGALAFDRDAFLDRRAPAVAVRLRATDLSAEESTWFQVDAPSPADLDAPVDVAVRTRAVTFALPVEQAGACADGRCRLELEAELRLDWLPAPSDADATEYRHFESIAEERPLRAGVPWTTRLAVGFRYRALVKGEAGHWTTPVIEPGTEPVTAVLRGDRLEAASDWPEIDGTLLPDP